MQSVTYKIFNNQNVTAFSTLRFSTSAPIEHDLPAQPYAGWNICPYSGENSKTIAKNRAELYQKSGTNPQNLIFPKQTHSSNVIKIDTCFLALDKEKQTKILNGVDGLITQIPDITLGIFTADCMAVFLFDPIQKAVGLVHSGWKGTIQRITEQAIRQMQMDYGTRPCDILTAVGPHISARNYEVGKEVIEAFASAGFDIRRISQSSDRPGHYLLSLSAAIRQSLVSAGVQRKNIQISRLCTYQHPERFFSARRLGAQSGRTLHCIRLNRH